ncbi:MAG: hypothetical protein KDF60_01080 [Calditrichaeota bacterium]|nr:hypothetical protein [Calditrichota bacterium]
MNTVIKSKTHLFKILILFMVFQPLVSFGQSQVLKIDEPGLAFSGSRIFGKNIQGFGYQFAFSKSGASDIGFSYQRAIVEEGIKKNWDFYSLFLRLHPGKEKTNRVLQPFLTLEYVKVGSEKHISGFSFEIGAYKIFNENQSVGFMPMVSCAISLLEAQVDLNTDLLSESVGFAGGLGILFYMPDNNVIQVLPSYSISDAVSSFDISIALLVRI